MSKMSEYYRGLYKQRRDAGMCARCNEPSPDKAICSDCRRRINAANGARAKEKYGRAIEIPDGPGCGRCGLRGEHVCLAPSWVVGASRREWV